METNTGDVVSTTTVGEQEDTPPAPAPLPQKIRGILMLKREWATDTQGTVLLHPPEILGYCSATDILNGTYDMNFESARRQGARVGARVFARPCPPYARHGYVESRQVDTSEELYALAKETAAEDADSYIALCKYIEGTWGAVWTPTSVTIGLEGNAAATDGRGCVTFETAPATNYDGASIQAGLHPGDAPYIEMVGGPHATHITQYRGGPALPTSIADYMPTAMVCQHIVEVDPAMSLLEWERRVATFAPETFVWHPKGSLSSHFGVHCLLHKVPYLTDLRPSLGRTYYPTDDLPDANPQGVHVRDGIRAAYPHLLTRSHAAALVLFTLHNPSLWGYHRTSREGSYLLGAAMSYAAQLACAAIAGEMRHYRRRKDLNRNTVHNACWHDPTQTIRRLPLYQHKFLTGNWKNGYGGPSWGRCTQATIRLIQACNNLLLYPLIPDFMTEGLTALNHLVHIMHNNGTMMNKFLRGRTLDYITQHDLLQGNLLATTGMATLLKVRGNPVHDQTQTLRYQTPWYAINHTIRLSAAVTNKYR